jgi:PAS domain S-box-containing protein
VLDRDDPDRLRLAMQGTRLGLWDWDMVTGQTVFNERWAEIIGYRLEELEPTTIETWAENAVPEDLEASNQAIAAHASGETDFYDVEVRMKHRDGHTVWVHDRGRIVEWLPDGSPGPQEPLSVGVSMGVVPIKPDDGLDIDELLRQADDASYAAKAQGGGVAVAGNTGTPL